ncbi:hypothetical protein KAE78_11080 [Microbacterium sp. NIBRBAC000506063]|nr:hypothetical protein KAE78_11080 [Microbacterium sp. NIBRBAC000506063]
MGGQRLLGDSEGAVEAHLTGIRGERTRQDVQERGLAAAVLADDPQREPGR